MPRESGKVTDRERAICNRVRLIRKSLKLSQKGFSNALGVSRDLVAGVEYARSPLRFGLALRLSALAGFSLKWIVEGVPPEKFRAPVGKGLLETIPNSYLLSEAWDIWIKPAFESAFKRAALNGKGEKPGQRMVVIGEENEIDPVPSDDLFEYLIEDLEGNFKAMPPYLHSDLYSQILKAARDFRNANSFEIIAFESLQKNSAQKNLQLNSLKSNNPDVKSQIQKLIERVKQKASKPGAKAELAKELDVAPARVSEWLSGKKEPGGEYTLRLLQWVEQE